MKAVVWLAVCAVSWQRTSCVGPHVEPCRAKDLVCSRNIAQRAIPVLAAGIPSRKLAALDPLQLQRIDIKLKDLDLDLEDVVIRGLKNCAALNVMLDNGKLNLTLKCCLSISAQSGLSGKMFMLPVDVNGKLRIVVKNLIINVSLDIVQDKFGGSDIYNVSSFVQTSEPPTCAKFQFHSDIEGTQGLVNEIQKYVNLNAVEIFCDIAPPMLTVVVDRVIDDVCQLLETVPLDDVLSVITGIL